MIIVKSESVDQSEIEGRDNLYRRLKISNALSLDTKLPTPNGWKTIESVRVLDFVFGEDGKSVMVVNKSKVFNTPMYRILLSDGRELKISEDHINVVIHRRQKRVGGIRVNYLDRRELTTQELLQIPLTAPRSVTIKNPLGKENRLWFPLPKAVEYPEQNLPVDPYTLGLAIGDGAMDHSTGYCRLHGHVKDLPHLLVHIPTRCGEMIPDRRFPNVVRVSLYGIGSAIKSLGLACHGNQKFVPEIYMQSSVRQRLSLLQGLMDTDGTVYMKGCAAFTSNSYNLAQGVQGLVFSLGGSAVISSMNEAYRVNVRLNLPLFRLPRKAGRQHFKCLERIPVVSIEKISQQPSQCLVVFSKERTFLAGDFVVTQSSRSI